MKKRYHLLRSIRISAVALLVALITQFANLSHDEQAGLTAILSSLIEFFYAKLGVDESTVESSDQVEEESPAIRDESE